jgi:N-acyl-L-homoserine lactone synthetase
MLRGNANFAVRYFSGCEDTRLMRRVLQFRTKLFVETLGWELVVVDGLESDEFDRPDTVYAALFDNGVLCGTFRAIRTDSPYLAENVFPDAAGHRGYPKSRSVWEISRFGVASTARRFGTARALYAAMLRFAFDRGARSLVAVADDGYERFLSVIGIRAVRFGAPLEIGTDVRGRPLSIVAGEIPMDGQDDLRFQTLLSLARDLEVIDVANVLGPEAVSA